MITRLYRRVLCHAGVHDPITCAGRQDHHWTWDTTTDRWVARLDRRHQPPVRPVADLPRPRRPDGTTSHRPTP